MDTFLSLLKQSYNSGKPLVGPLSASVPLTSRCNSRCLYCPPSRTRKEKEPSLVQLKELFKQLANLGVHFISLTGGEPTLRSDLEEIVMAARESRLIPSLLTNGTLLTEARVVSLISAGIQGFVVSLDSTSPQTYRAIRGVSVMPVLEAIDILARIRNDHDGIFACVTSVITKHNFRDLPTLATNLIQRGLHYQIQPVLNQPQVSLDPNDQTAMDALRNVVDSVLDIYSTRYTLAEKRYTKAIHQYISSGRLPHEFSCLGMFLLVHMDVEFNVYPCWLFPTIGSAKMHEIADLWNSDKMHAARMKLKEEGCPGCWLLCDAKPSLQYQLEEVFNEN